MNPKKTFLPLALFAVAAPLVADDGRPNILWLTFEDTSPTFIGCYGNETAVTPVMDSLAAEGILYRNAFSTGTVSSPSRFCLMTGCRPGRYGTGNHRSLYPIPEFVHGFPEYLRNAGYYTSNNSKTDYNHKSHREMAQASWDDCSGKASWRNRKPGQPFFAVVNLADSHQSRTMTNPWWHYEEQVLQRMDPDRILAPDADFEMPPYYHDSPAMRKEVSRTYNSISYTDEKFGKILDALEADGLRDSTIIFLFSDHGEGIPRGKGSALGSGYQIPFILWVPDMYKELIPSGRGTVCDDLVSFEDFGATVLQLAGVDIPEYIEGVPFLPQRTGKKPYIYGACDAVDSNTELSRSVIDGQYIYTRVFTPYQPWVRWIAYYDHADIQKVMRKELEDGRLSPLQREIMSPRQTGYLYDLRNDRWETHNLAEDPAYSKKVKKMHSALMKHLLQTRDANFIPEYYLDRKGLDRTPYDLRLDDNFFPAKEVIRTADLIGKGSAVIPEQLDQALSPNPIVSYWACVGLFTQREQLRPYLTQVQDILRRITHEPARVWLAAGICNLTDDVFATSVLREAILDPNPYISIYALNTLMEIDLDKARKFIPVLDESEKMYGHNATRPGVESMMMIARLRLQDKEFFYGTYW